MFLFAVEVASRNELGLHTSWKLASWQSAHRTASLVKIDGATLTVKQNGLYLIYAQVNTRSTFIHLHSVHRSVDGWAGNWSSDAL
jgi:hypothetical protein